MQKPRIFRNSDAPAILLLLATLVATSACERKRPSDREVWADVDGQPIYRDEVERIYRSRLATGTDAASAEQVLSFKLNILNELINNQILVAHAAHARITASEAEVDGKVAQLQSAYSSEEFQNKLKEQGLDLADLRRELRHGIIITKLINKEISSRISVSDSEIAEYYARNKATFNVPETEYHLAQIQVTPVADREVRNLKNDDAKTLVAAERKVQALYARLRAGEDFAAVAQAYSEDPRTAAGGGDLGFIPASALNTNPQLKQVVSALKVNQISGIMRGPDGYHIVKLLGREERGQRLLSDVQVQNAIRQTLRNEKEQLLKTAYIEVLRNRAKVTNYFAEQTVKGEASPGASR